MVKLKKFIPIPISGLDTSGPATLIDSRATPNCSDVRVSYTHIKKIEGDRQIGSAISGVVQKIVEFDRESSKYLVRISPTTFEVWTDGSQAWADKTGTALQGKYIQPVSAAQSVISGKGILVFTNYFDSIKKYTVSAGDIEALGGSPPRCKFVFPYKGYLTLGYINDSGVVYPYRIQWPDTDDPETWTEGDTVNAGHDDLDDNTDPLAGINGLGDLIIPFKSSGIYNGYLTDDTSIFKFDFVERRLGWLANNSVKQLPGGKLIGLGKTGLVEYNGISAQLVATGIMDDIRWNINPQYAQCAFGEVVEELNEYWLWVPTGSNTYPDLVYRCNYLTGQVYRGVSSNVTAAGLKTQLEAVTWNLKTGKWNAQTGKWNDVVVASIFPILVTGDSDGKCYVFDYDQKNRHDVAIDAWWDSKDYDSVFFFGEEYAGHYFHLTELFIDGAEGDAVSVYYSTDEGTTYTLLETITLSASPATYRIPCDIFTDKIRIRLRNNTASSTFEFRNITFTRPALREVITRT